VLTLGTKKLKTQVNKANIITQKHAFDWQKLMPVRNGGQPACPYTLTVLHTAVRILQK